MISRVFRTSLLLVPLLAASLAFAASAKQDRATWYEMQLRGDDVHIAGATFSSAAHGALTLDSVYAFDFATVGIGTLIFRPARNHPSTLLFINQDMPLPGGNWDYETKRIDAQSFVGSFGTFVNSPVLSFAEDGSVNDIESVSLVPEPATWIGGALALGVVAFTQRRRLRALR